MYNSSASTWAECATIAATARMNRVPSLPGFLPRVSQVGARSESRDTVIGVEPRALIGEWTMARRVVDRSAGTYGTVAGALVVTAFESGVRFAESGVLRWQGAELPVYRV